MTVRTSRYRSIADTLRGRINEGDYPVGTKLPSIARLQAEFDVPGLNTIRDAQKILVREGLLRTEQGVGAWVIAQASPTADRASVLEALQDARAAVDRAITFLENDSRAAPAAGDVATAGVVPDVAAAAPGQARPEEGDHQPRVGPAGPTRGPDAAGTATVAQERPARRRKGRWCLVEIEAAHADDLSRPVVIMSTHASEAGARRERTRLRAKQGALPADTVMQIRPEDQIQRYREWDTELGRPVTRDGPPSQAIHGGAAAPGW